MSNTLCIKGLSNNCNQDKLKSALECFGPCTIDIQGNVAQVTYLSEESVLKAVPSLNRTNLLGANSNDVEITSLNPKVNKWSYYSAPSINENFKYTDMQGKSSPNFGGFSSKIRNENINPNIISNNIMNTSQGISIQNKSQMNIEISKPVEEKPKIIPKFMDHEYLKGPVNTSKKLAGLVEMWSKNKSSEPVVQIINSPERVYREQMSNSTSINEELDPIQIENTRLRNEDLNNLTYSELQDLLTKRNITPAGNPYQSI